MLLSSCGAANTTTPTPPSGSDAAAAQPSASGATPQASAPAEKTKLVFWTAIKAELGMGDVAKAFQSKNPDIEVEIVDFTND